MFKGPDVNNILSANIEIFEKKNGEDDYLSAFSLNMKESKEMDIALFEALSEALQHAKYKIDKLVMTLKYDK
jgi:hypothetical protein